MKRAVVALIFTFGAVACGGGGAGDASPKPSPTATAPRPATTAKLLIVEPSPGQKIKGSKVVVKLRLEGGTIVEAASTNLKPTEGHLHVSLDGKIVSHTFGLEQELKDLAAGVHALRVEFVAADHVPFNPRHIVNTTFTTIP